MSQCTLISLGVRVQSEVDNDLREEANPRSYRLITIHIPCRIPYSEKACCACYLLPGRSTESEQGTQADGTIYGLSTAQKLAWIMIVNLAIKHVNGGSVIPERERFLHCSLTMKLLRLWETAQWRSSQSATSDVRRDASRPPSTQFAFRGVYMSSSLC